MKTHENSNRQTNAGEGDCADRCWRRHHLLLLAALVVVVGLVGVLVWDLTLQNKKVPGCEHTAVLGITILIQSMIAFFGILNLEESHSKRVSPLTKGGMRCAIAGAFVVSYLSLVIFHTMMDFTVGSPVVKDSVRDSFVNSFTGIVGLTIGFYFASEAAIHAVNVLKPRQRILEKPTVDAQHNRPNGSASEIRLTPR